MSIFKALFEGGGELGELVGDEPHGKSRRHRSYYEQKEYEKKKLRRKTARPITSSIPKPKEVQAVGGGIMIEHDRVNHTVTATEAVAHLTNSGAVELAIEQHTFAEGDQPLSVVVAEAALLQEKEVIKPGAKAAFYCTGWRGVVDWLVIAALVGGAFAASDDCGTIRQTHPEFPAWLKAPD